MFSSTAKDKIADRISSIPKAPDANIEAEVSNEVTDSQPPVGEYGNPDNDSGSEAPMPKAEDFKPRDRARSVTMWNKAHHVQDGTNRDRNDPAFVSVDDAPASLSLQIGDPIERNESKLNVAADTMLAAGMGFLLLQSTSNNLKASAFSHTTRNKKMPKILKSKF
jgi:hypothetical protein